MCKQEYKIRQVTLAGKRLVFTCEQATKNYRHPQLYIFILSISFIFFLIDYLNFSTIMPPATRMFLFLGAGVVYFAVNLLFVFMFFPIGNKFPNFYLPTFIIPIPCVILVSCLLRYSAEHYSNGEFEWSQSFWLMTATNYIIILIFEAFAFEYLLPMPTEEAPPAPTRPPFPPAPITIKIGLEAFVVSEILHIVSVDHYIEVTTKHKTTTIRGSLKSVLPLLPSNIGNQISRSVWVAHAAVREVRKGKNTTTIITIDNKSFRATMNV